MYLIVIFAGHAGLQRWGVHDDGGRQGHCRGEYHHQVSQQTLTEQMFTLGLENFQPRAPLRVPLV